MQPHGRLTLTWTGKDAALINTPNGGYEWVSQDDVRVHEVRRLLPEDHCTSGVAEPTPGATDDNMLIIGDSSDALRVLIHHPDYAHKYRGKVKLVYVDPPFNTRQTFEHYDDGLEHSVWMTVMRDRLVQIYDLLSDDGSVWVHLDDAEMAYLKVIMDEVFGRRNYVTSVIWRKVDSPNDNKVTVTPDHENILCYTKVPSTRNSFNRKVDPALAAAYGKVAEDGSRYRDRLLRKNGKNSLRTDRETMFFKLTDPDGNDVYPIRDDGREGCWAAGVEGVRRAEAEGRLIWTKRVDDDGVEKWVPYTREYAPETPERPWATIWTDVHTSRQTKAHLKTLFPDEGSQFSTPKPELLLERIIHIASNPGDIVLDCFGGSGTTAAVAHKMGRRWVTVELSEKNVNTFTKPRLEKVINNEDAGGITMLPPREVPTEDDFPEGGVLADYKTASKVLKQLVNTGLLESNDPAVAELKRLTASKLLPAEERWGGGGSFGVYTLAPSMFTVDEDGYPLFADDSLDGVFTEGARVQLGFAKTAVDRYPFAGRRDNTLLAVVDGIVSAGNVRDIVKSLRAEERVIVASKGIAPGASELLRELSPGSHIKKFPLHTSLDLSKAARS
jgi:adenine-specific DNA-methyltransferase